jgi:hypothetical protein
MECARDGAQIREPGLKCPIQMEAKKDLSPENQKTGLIEGGLNLAMS